jgi:hypothetical protein
VFVHERFHNFQHDIGNNKILICSHICFFYGTQVSSFNIVMCYGLDDCLCCLVVRVPGC